MCVHRCDGVCYAELEQQMLQKLHKKNWTDGLMVEDYEVRRREHSSPRKALQTI